MQSIADCFCMKKNKYLELFSKPVLYEAVRVVGKVVHRAKLYLF